MSNILPGYCSGTLEIMKKKLFQIRIFSSELCCLGAKKMFRMGFFPGFTFKLVFIGRLSLVAACFCRFSLIFWCFFPKFSGGDGGKWRDIAHLTLGGYSPYYFFYGFGDYSIIIIIIIIIIIVVDRGLACMDCFRPNAHSIPLISFTLALTIILMVACLILLHIPL